MLKIITVIILLMCSFIISYGQIGQKNIFEYGVVSYGDEGFKGPFATRWIKVYDDKTIIYYKEGDYYQAKLGNKNFDKLKKFLSTEPLLFETKYLDTKNGNGIPGLHGGFFYMYYLSDNDRKIIVSYYEPSEGEWTKIVKTISKLRVKSKKKLDHTFRVKFDETLSDTDGEAIWFAYDFYEQHNKLNN